MTVKAIALTLSLAVCACSNTAPMQEEQVGAVIQPIFQGTEGGYASVVGVSVKHNCNGTMCNFDICTGTIVSRHLVLTANHCLANMEPSGTNQRSGEVAIEYWNPRTQQAQCLTRTSGDMSGHCFNFNTDFVSMTGFANSFTTTTSDRSHDVGLIGGASFNWPSGIDESDVADIAAYSVRDDQSAGAAVRAGDEFFAIGYGTGAMGLAAGVLRFDPDPFKADAVSNGTMRNTASSVRLCSGDSGSPALWTYPEAQIVAGVFSGDNDQGDRCVDPGTNQYWGLTETAIGFISEVIESVDPGACQGREIAATDRILFGTYHCW